MPELTTEAALQILIDWLCDNINCDTPIIFDNGEDNTNSATLIRSLQGTIYRPRSWERPHKIFLREPRRSWS